MIGVVSFLIFGVDASSEVDVVGSLNRAGEYLSLCADPLEAAECLANFNTSLQAVLRQKMGGSSENANVDGLSSGASSGARTPPPPTTLTSSPPIGALEFGSGVSPQEHSLLSAGSESSPALQLPPPALTGEKPSSPTEGKKGGKKQNKIPVVSCSDKRNMTTPMKGMVLEAESHLSRLGVTQEILDRLFIKVARLISEGEFFLPACEDAGCQEQALYWIMFTRQYGKVFLTPEGLTPVSSVLRNYLCSAYLLSCYGQVERGPDSVFGVNIPERVKQMSPETYLALKGDLSESVTDNFVVSNRWFAFLLSLKRIVSLHTKSQIYSFQELNELQWVDKAGRKKHVPIFGHVRSVEKIFELARRDSIPVCILETNITGKLVKGNSVQAGAEYQLHLPFKEEDGLSLCFHVNCLNFKKGMNAFLDRLDSFQEMLVRWAHYTDFVQGALGEVGGVSFVRGKPDRNIIHGVLSLEKAHFGGSHVSLLNFSQVQRCLDLFNTTYCADTLREPPKIKAAIC